MFACWTANMAPIGNWQGGFGARRRKRPQMQTFWGLLSGTALLESMERRHFGPERRTVRGVPHFMRLG